MAFPTAVNDQITDSVTQANTKVLGDAPAIAMGNLYQATAQALANAAHNATNAQQQSYVTAQSATTMGVATLYSIDTASTGVATRIGDAAAHLSPVVGMLENLLDPECIVFGGALPNALLDDLIAALDPLPLSVAGRRKRALPRIVRGTTGLFTAALGAAALPLLETMTPKLDTAPAIESTV